MTLGLLHLNRRGRVRALAAFVVGFLMAGHVLAASGLCVITVPQQPDIVRIADGPCLDHAGEATPGLGARHHCPSEEPSPQVRVLDLPAAQAVAELSAVGFYLVELFSETPLLGRIDHQAPPPSLYARLQRLRL